MGPILDFCFCRKGPGWLVAVLGLAGLFSPAAMANTNISWKAEATVRETYDSNVYLQDVTPNPANVLAAQAAGFHPVEANKASWVTSVLPKLGLEYRAGAALAISAAYAPDVTFYHSAPDEDYAAHRGTFNFGGKIDETSWELLNTATYIDGGTEGPSFARPDDIPALGAIPVRDRRAAFIFKNGFRIKQPFGDFFVRPVASSYIHDFKTDLRYVPPATRASYSYENYIDRQEVYGGVDVGYRVVDKTDVVLGYRYRRQDQFKGPYGPGGALIDSPFDSVYHRVLGGLEGSPADWLKVTLLAGPDIRQFSSDAQRLYPAFDPDTLLWYSNGALTWLPRQADAVTLRSTHFEQPAFSSFSMYEDFRTELLWKHAWGEQLSCTLGFILYIGDWQAPVHRDDWVYTPNGSVAYNFTKHFRGELSYSYDWCDSFVSTKVEPL